MKKLFVTFVAFILVFTSVQSPLAQAEEEVSTQGAYEPMLLAGYDFSIARLTDGTWWSWGANDKGQLGLGDNENRMYPVRITSPTLDKAKVRKAQVIDTTVYVHLDNGELWHWGETLQGNSIRSHTPRRITTVDDFAFTQYTQALNRHDALLMTKGNNTYVAGSGFQGQFGRGINGHGAAEKNSSVNFRSITESPNYPVLKTSIVKNYPGSIFKYAESGVPLTGVKMSAGSSVGYNFMAVTNTGEIYTWGREHGLNPVLNPNKIPGNIVDLKMGVSNYALNDRNELYQWEGPTGKPSKITSLKVKSISEYNGRFSFVTTTGDLYTRDQRVSTDFKLIDKNVVASAMGYKHSLWMTADGKVWGEGWNAYRQLAVSGDGIEEKFTRVPGLDGVTKVGAVHDFTMAAKGAGLYSWGDTVGDLGGARTSPRLSKTFEAPIIEIDGIATGGDRITSFLLNNGSGYVFGNNYHYRLGYGPGANHVFRKLTHKGNSGAAFKPNVVNGKTYVQPYDAPLSAETQYIVDINQGANNGLAVGRDGTLLAWGRSTAWGRNVPGVDYDLQDFGGSGVNQKSTEHYIRVGTDKKFVKATGGSATKLALGTDGKVYTWGADHYESLGRDSSTPYQVKPVNNLKDITDISMAVYTGLATDKNGDIWSWGHNNIGQLGDGSIGDKMNPVNITQDVSAKFTSVHAGAYSNYAITDKGELYSWGNNRYGQLGLGDRVNRTSPRKVEGLPSGVKDVANGTEHTIILLNNGQVFTAGSNSKGQLGLGTPQSTVGKTEIPFPDYITINNKDNELVEMGSGRYLLTGSVTSVVDNYDLEIHYKVENSLGVVESGLIKKLKSSRTPVTFDYSFGIDSKYILGGHTLSVEVRNVSTKLSNATATNFAVVDRTPPTPPVIDNDDKWYNTTQTKVIIPGQESMPGSGYNRTEYNLNNEAWVEYSSPIAINKEGVNNLLARGIDNSGNISKLASSQVKIDITKPTLELSLQSQNISNEDVTILINANDNLSGVSVVKEVTSGDIVTNEYKVRDNGVYTFEVIDNAGNTNVSSIKVDNLDKTLSIDPPIAESNNIHTLNGEDYLFNLSDMYINDWRDNINSWRLQVHASPLTSDNRTLKAGSLWVKALDIDNSNVELNKEWIPLDSGVTTIAKAIESRGKHKLTFESLKLKIDLGDILVGKYTSTITWDLIQAP